MKKTLKILIPIVLVLLIGGAATLYFFTDLFKSPRTLFYKYLSNTFKSETKYSYDDFLDNLKFYNDKACKTSAEITFDSKFSDSELADAQKLNDFKIVSNSLVGPKQENSYIDTTLYYKNQDLSTLEYLNSNNSYGLKCNDIYKDYFYIENKNLKDLATKFGIDSDAIPDSISKVNIYDFLYVDKDTREKIMKKTFDAINSDLDKDNFSAEKGEEIKVNGKKIKADSYTLSLNSKDFYNVMINFCEFLKEDDEILDLWFEKYNMLYGNYDFAKLSKEELKNSLDDAITEFKYSKETVDSTSGKIKITVYTSKGKTVKLQLKSGFEVLALDLTENKKDGIMSLYYKSDDTVVFNFENNYKIDGDKTSGTVICTSDSKELAKIEYVYTDSDSKIGLYAKTSINTSGSSDFINPSSSDSDPVFVELNYEISGDNLKDKPTKLNFAGFVKFGKNLDDNYLTINLKGSCEYTDSVDIPSFESAGGVCLNTASNADLENIKVEINTNLNTFIDTILSKFELTRDDVDIPAGNIDFFGKTNELLNLDDSTNTHITLDDIEL